MNSTVKVCVFLAVFVSFDVIGNAFNFEGCMSSKCTQAGPDYWCKSYDTVLECNAVTLCGNIFKQSTAVPFDQSQCSFGTSFWCQNLQNAVRCGQQAVVECSRRQPVSPAPGSDPCLNGPSYWCQSMSVALKCGSEAFGYCKNQSDQVNTKPLPGADQCTWGPSHICKDFQLASKCRASFEVCNRQYGSLLGSASSAKTG